MKQVAAKLLNFEQKQWWMKVAKESLKEVNDDAELLKCIITGDETWVYGFKAQSSQWKHSGSPGQKKGRQVRSNVKVMLIVFFDFNGIVHHEFLPPD